jgi:hypothetical protein
MGQIQPFDRGHRKGSNGWSKAEVPIESAAFVTTRRRRGACRAGSIWSRRRDGRRTARHLRGLPNRAFRALLRLFKRLQKEIASALLDLGFQGLGDFRNLGGAERV